MEAAQASAAAGWVDKATLWNSPSLLGQYLWSWARVCSSAHLTRLPWQALLVAQAPELGSAEASEGHGSTCKKARLSDQKRHLICAGIATFGFLPQGTWAQGFLPLSILGSASLGQVVVGGSPKPCPGTPGAEFSGALDEAGR